MVGHGCDIIVHGIPWVGIATILLGMGGHIFDIIVHGWAWLKQSILEGVIEWALIQMLSRVRAPNHLHPVRWVHPLVCLLPVRFCVGSWVYKVADLEKNKIIAAVSLALPMNRDTTAKLNVSCGGSWKEPPHSPSCRAWRVRFCASNSKLESNFSDAGNTLTKKRSGLKPTAFYLSDPTKTWYRWVIHITFFAYMGAIWIAWVGVGGHGCNLKGKCWALRSTTQRRRL